VKSWNPAPAGFALQIRQNPAPAGFLKSKSGTALQSSDWLWRPPPKWPILCQVGR